MTERPSRRALLRPFLREEVSAGGIVLGPNGVLLIKVKNLEGNVLWTFPKGHIEKGESLEQTALREVQEETGWKCHVTGDVGVIRYEFRRDLRPVLKTVHWFYMAPDEKVGQADPEEVVDCRWYSFAEAAALLVYKSDQKLMSMLLRKGL